VASQASAKPLQVIAMLKSSSEAKPSKLCHASSIVGALACSALIFPTLARADLVFGRNSAIAGDIQNSQGSLVVESEKHQQRNERYQAERVHVEKPGNDSRITLDNLTLNVYGPSRDDTQTFTGSYEGLPLGLTFCSGQRKNCDDPLVLDDLQADMLRSIFNSSPRLGLAADFSDATGGPNPLFLSSGAMEPVPGLAAVPAPLIGHGLFVLLAIGGFLFGGKPLDSLKKYRSLAALPVG